MFCVPGVASVSRLSILVVSVSGLSILAVSVPELSILVSVSGSSILDYLFGFL